MTSGNEHLSIWFFVGLLLLVYGVLILGSGIYSLYSPPKREVALASLHADIWWGALLVGLGCIYSYFFSPWRRKAQAKLQKSVTSGK